MTEQKNNFPDFYITAPQECPYLPNRMERKLFTHISPDKPKFLIDNLLTGGFRRSQNIAYMPYCDSCNACISIRVMAKNFNITRSMKRIKKNNNDLIRKHIRPDPTSEQYDLFSQYISQRHSDGGMSDMSMFDYSMMLQETMVKTFITEYRLPASNDTKEHQLGPLKAVAICDLLIDGISLVYSFYDTELDKRSLGTFLILDHIEYAKQLGLPYVYLGYWIRGSDKMEYKIRFQPQQHLTPHGWRQSKPKTVK